MKLPYVRLGITMDPKLHKRVKKLAKDSRMSLSKAIENLTHRGLACMARPATSIRDGFVGQTSVPSEQV